MQVRMLDGRVTSRGPRSPGAIVELPATEANWFIRQRWADPAPPPPGVIDTVGVQAPPPQVVPTEPAQAEPPAQPREKGPASGRRGGK